MPCTALPPLPQPVAAERIEALALELQRQDPSLTLLRESADRVRYSRDCHDYSPVLTPLLAGRIAQLVVRVRSVEQVMAVAGACARHGVPLTARGAGTGNYGQCVPLCGGVVIDLMGLNRLRQLDPASGVMVAEAGCILANLDQELRLQGRSLRLAPSTWRTASLGGFIGGGSSGIGSLRWGMLRDPGQLLALEVITAEPEPRRLWLEGEACEPLNHAYGCNGLITALAMATTEAVAWWQWVVDFDDWEAAVAVAQELPATALLVNSLCLLEAPLAASLPSPGGAPAASGHRLLLLAAADATPLLEPWLRHRGATCVWHQAESTSRGLPLRELTWNHTTLHWRSQQPGWTYLQLMLPRPAEAMLAALRQRWGPDLLLWHMEGVRSQGENRLAGLPVLLFDGIEKLEALIADCLSLGAQLFDPHTIYVEDGGLGLVDAGQVAAKASNDPAGLLNPGKLRGWLERNQLERNQ